MPQRDALVSRQLALFQALEPAVRGLALLSPDEIPRLAPDTSFIRCRRTPERVSGYCS